MTELRVHHWPAVTPPARGSVLLLHGLGEHALRHSKTAQWLATDGLNVIAPDLPGHGRSPGRRGDAPHIESMLDAVQVEWERFNAPRPHFLLGHSFGGLLAVPLALRLGAALDGLVLSSPFFDVARAPAAWQRFAAWIFLRIAPSLPLPTGLDVTALSRDPQVIAAYRADPLVHGKLSSRLYASARALQPQLETIAAQLKLPVLHFHGDQDRLTSCPASVRIAKHWTHPRSRLEVVPGGFHELHDDLDAAKFYQQLRDWIAQQLDAPVSPR